MSELERHLVLLVAFAAFLLAGYLQGGGTWRGPSPQSTQIASRERRHHRNAERPLWM
jgi:hypothetical protein